MLNVSDEDSAHFLDPPEISEIVCRIHSNLTFTAQKRPDEDIHAHRPHHYNSLHIYRPTNGLYHPSTRNHGSIVGWRILNMDQCSIVPGGGGRGARQEHLAKVSG